LLGFLFQYILLVRYFDVPSNFTIRIVFLLSIEDADSMITDRLSGAPPKAKSASGTPIHIDNGIEHAVEKYGIVNAWLLAGEADHTMMGDTPLRRDTKFGIDLFGCLRIFQTQYILFTGIGTLFTESTATL
jgi:hypothetical protein